MAIKVTLDTEELAKGRPPFKLTCTKTGRYIYAATRKTAEATAEKGDFDDFTIMLIEGLPRFRLQVMQRVKHLNDVNAYVIRHDQGADFGELYDKNTGNVLGHFYIDYSEPCLTLKLF